MSLLQALAGIPCLQQWIAAKPRDDDRALFDERGVASMLAGVLSGAREEEIAAVFEILLERRWVRIHACLTQELILRGRGAADSPAVGRSLDRLALDGHEFAWLPPDRHQLELAIVWPALASQDWHGRARTSWGRYHWPADLLHCVAMRDRFHVQAIPEATERLQRWLSRVQELDNIQLEAGVWGLAGSLEPVQLFGALPLASTGTTNPKRLAVEEVAPSEALRQLFLYVQNGGAYSQRAGSAWARLDAWRALGTMAGAPAEAAWPVVAEHAFRCTWYLFDAPDSTWFWHELNDLGVLALGPTTCAAVACSTTS